MSFIEYIKSLGYKPHKVTIEKSGNKTARPVGDIAANDFSTVASPPGLDTHWILGDKTIVWGLYEKGYPPTLISPRPKSVTIDGDKHMNNYDDPTTMDRLLNKYPPDVLYNALWDRTINLI